MVKLLTIAINTFRETLRQPIYLVLVITTFLVLITDTALTGYSMEVDMQSGDLRMLVNLGLSTLLMSGLLLAVFAASSTLAREIERRTLLTVVAKPVHRPVILLGKYLGVLAATTVGFYLCVLVFLMTVRHGTRPAASDPWDLAVLTFGIGGLALAVLGALFCNFFFGWAYTSTSIYLKLITLTVAMVLIGFIGQDWQPVEFFEGIDPEILKAILLLWLALVVISALAVTLSTRLGQMPTLGVCLVGFFLSMVADSIFGRYVDENLVARVGYWLAPNLKVFFVLDALARQETIPGRYIAWVTGYAAAYSSGLLLLGMALLETREMDVREGSSIAPGMVNVLAWAMRIGAVAAGLVGLTILGGLPDASGVVLGAALLAGGTLGWLLAGGFGKGKRWALALTVLLGVGQLGVSVVSLFAIHPELLPPDRRLAVLAGSLALALYVVIMLTRRATRDFFVLGRKRRIAAAAASV